MSGLHLFNAFTQNCHILIESTYSFEIITLPSLTSAADVIENSEENLKDFWEKKGKRDSFLKNLRKKQSFFQCSYEGRGRMGKLPLIEIN